MPCSGGRSATSRASVSHSLERFALVRGNRSPAIACSFPSSMDGVALELLGRHGPVAGRQLTAAEDSIHSSDHLRVRVGSLGKKEHLRFESISNRSAMTRPWNAGVDGGQQEQGRTKWMKWLGKGLFSHVGLFLLVGAYCVGGAYLFIYLEWEGIEQKNQAAIAYSGDIERQRGQLAQDLWMYKGASNFNDTVADMVGNYHKNVTKMIAMTDVYVGDKLDNHTITNGWIFPSALLFTITIVTTIGYGNVTPVTAIGQLTVIFYALIGVPLMLMFLANIGDAMATFFRLAYGRGCCYFCWKKRKSNYELNKQRLREIREHGRPLTSPDGKPIDYGGKTDPNALSQYEIVEMMEDPDDEVINVPISLTLVVIAAYVFIGAVLFASWNHWTWIKGAYFSFVTLSTIGFGDLVPGWEEVGTSAGNLKLVISCVYIVFGLAVLSMSFNLMMEEMFSKFRWLGQKLGIVADPNLKITDDKKPLITEIQPPPIDAKPYQMEKNGKNLTGYDNRVYI